MRSLFKQVLVLALSGISCTKPITPNSTIQSGPLAATDSDDKDSTADVEAAPKVRKPAVQPVTQAKRAPQIDSFVAAQKLDLVVVVDRGVVADRGINLITQQFAALSKGLAAAMDTQIHFLVSGVLNLPDLDPKKIGFINQNVAANGIIGQLNTLFANGYTNSYVDAAGQRLPAPLAFRPDARLEILVYSTGNGTGNGNLAANFDPQNILKATLSAVVALPDSTASATCRIQAVGKEYSDLSKKLNGSTLDICAADFAKIGSTLSSDIAGRSFKFALSQQPADLKAITVTANGKALPAEAWAYDAPSNTIRIVRAEAVVIGAKLAAEYEVAADKSPDPAADE